MKLLIISDSHGRNDLVRAVCRAEKPDALLHLGDYARDADGAPCGDIYAVRGNCDGRSKAPESIFTELDGVKVFMTHGHAYNVKLGIYSAVNAACARGADVLLFGHTHSVFRAEKNGLLIANPGSLRYGAKTYAILNTEHGVCSCDIKFVSDVIRE